jgi:GGDEF domain-containing protein
MPSVDQTPDHDSIYEVAILAFAEIIKSATRAEDLCARLGKGEFTLILKAPLEVGRSLSQRILESWTSTEFSCESAYVLSEIGESSLELLNRLDNQELRGPSIS